MSTRVPLDPPRDEDKSAASISAIIDCRSRDLEGFDIRRVLPAAARRSVGPFLFLDHFGPTELPPGRGLVVRPHPHIGLAAVTYLFEGELVHRDSLGSLQVIRPGAINWMTAGRGIVHSERMRDEVVAAGSRLHGLQLWLALPVAAEEIEPSFNHHSTDTLPELSLAGARVRVMAGTAYGETSPVSTLSPLFYVDAALPAGSELPVPDDYEERAVYVVEGELRCGAERAKAGRMLVFSPGAQINLSSVDNARVVILGGAPLDGERHMFWNFVSSRRDRIEQAKNDWKAERFPLVPGDEDERTPLPGP